MGPAGRAVGRDQTRLARAPDGHAYGDHHGHQAASARDGATNVKDVRRIGVEKEPPLEQLPRVVDRRAKEIEPRRAKTYLLTKGRSCPLCGAPHSGDRKSTRLNSTH